MNFKVASRDQTPLPNPLPWVQGRGRTILGLAIGLAIASLVGCSTYPQLIEPDIRRPIDRSIIETPANYYIKLAVRNLTAPTAMSWVREEGEYKDTLLIAESGEGQAEPRIFGFRKRDGAELQIYPHGPKLPTFGLIHPKQQLYGPIGGMTVSQGRIYVTHKNAEGKGRISALSFDGQITVLQDDLPSQGDFGLTDIAVHPTTGRIWFGQGSATNSGVVGPDNFMTGWVKKFPNFSDAVPQNIKLLGLKFFTKNPAKGLFGDDNVGTGPYQPFGTNNQLRVHADSLGKPTSAVYSIAPQGGDLKAEAWGIHNPRGLGFDEYSNAYAINDGMEMRGTRPVANDPDSLIKIVSNAWYGFPDYSTDLNPVSNTEYQPPQDMIESSGGYPEVAALIDRNASGLTDPSVYKSQLFWGSVSANSGAAKFDFTPGTGAFREFPNSVIVALSGDRAPFSTSGQPIAGPVGYKVVRFDMLTKRAEDFVRNTKQLPSSRINQPQALERPIDVKFGPDGLCYVLDFGKTEMRGGKMTVTPGTGRIFVIEPMPQAGK